MTYLLLGNKFKMSSIIKYGKKDWDQKEVSHLVS